MRNTQESVIPRNLDPSLHPLERAREYTAALNATKLERMFAQPFVGQLGKGTDGVYSIAKNLHVLNKVASGSGDGKITYWDLTSRDQVSSFKAHDGIVHGLTVTPTGHMLSCGADRTVKLWEPENEKKLVKTYLGEFGFVSVDHHRTDNVFATGGAKIQLWNLERNKPVYDLSWGADNVSCVRFNQTETSVLASAGSDRSIILYDIRTHSPIQKLVTTMSTNSICWNPMEAFNFAAANEDHNTYYYDMRKLDRSLNVWKGHVAAVLDVDFSPTGKEVVTGSYDKSIRIFDVTHGQARDIYHTKRMQRVFISKFTMDSKYILSGSDDGNIRVWRSVASDRSRILSARQRSKQEYGNTLKQRYKHMPDIKKIARHRHLPHVVKKAAEIKRIGTESMQRKERNVRRTKKNQDLPYQSEKAKHIIGTAIKYKDTKD